MQVTGFGYEHDELWAQNLEFFKHFTDKTQGVRRLGAAAIDLCHVALGEGCKRGITTLLVQTPNEMKDPSFH